MLPPKWIIIDYNYIIRTVYVFVNTLYVFYAHWFVQSVSHSLILIPSSYKNAYFINANSATAPGIVDADRQPILERSEVYSGVYGRASINLYAFNSNGNKGIACGLNNLQKIRDGEPLGGKSRAEDDFATADDEDDFLD